MLGEIGSPQKKFTQTLSRTGSGPKTMLGEDSNYWRERHRTLVEYKTAVEERKRGIKGFIRTAKAGEGKVGRAQRINLIRQAKLAGAEFREPIVYNHPLLKGKKLYAGDFVKLTLDKDLQLHGRIIGIFKYSKIGLPMIFIEEKERHLPKKYGLSRLKSLVKLVEEK